jgi:PhnB protein
MANPVRPIPEGYHTLTPYLVCRNADRAIGFYKQAFGAQELLRMPGPAGKIAHAELKIGDSMLFLSDEFAETGVGAPELAGNRTISLFLYVEDVDAVFNRAVAAGARTEMPVQDMFWGDRYGKLIDPFGHLWSIATHKEDVAPEELQRRSETFFTKAAGQG